MATRDLQRITPTDRNLCVKLLEMSIGVLVSHPSHVDWARNRWPECILIAREQITIQIHPKGSVQYLYPELESSNNLEETVIFLADNWYRNNDGIDQVQNNEFSVAQVLTGSIRIGLATQIREFEAVQHWCSQLTKLYVSHSENEFIKRALNQHLNMVEYYEPPNYTQPFSRWLENRLLRDYLSLNRKWARSSVMRGVYVFQRCLFRSTRRTCKIIFSDWTDSFQFSKQKCLWTNQKDLRKSALIFSTRRLLKESAWKVSLQKVSFANSDWISIVLKRGNYAVNQKLIELLSQYLQDCVLRNSSIIALYHAQMSVLFKNYDIESIQVPAELFEPYVMAMQLARANGIKTTLSVDGHDPTGLSVPTLRTPDNQGYLLDNFVTPSDVLYNSALKMGFLDDQIIRTNSKFHLLHQVNKERKIEFDAMVMTWIPNHQNPDARIDSPSATLESSLKILGEHFEGKIAVKVKDLRLEQDYVAEIIHQLGLSQRIEILSGRFSEHVNSTRLIVGGISSAIAEAMIHEVPYVIFEPQENGYSDLCLEQSSVLDIKRIARTSEDLLRLVKDGRSSIEVDARSYLYSSKAL